MPPASIEIVRTSPRVNVGYLGSTVDGCSCPLQHGMCVCIDSRSASSQLDTARLQNGVAATSSLSPEAICTAGGTCCTAEPMNAFQMDSQSRLSHTTVRGGKGLSKTSHLFSRDGREIWIFGLFGFGALFPLSTSVKSEFRAGKKTNSNRLIQGEEEDEERRRKSARLRTPIAPSIRHARAHTQTGSNHVRARALSAHTRSAFS